MKYGFPVMARVLGAAFLWMALSIIGRAETAPPNPDAGATLVVYNLKDDDSGMLARFYAEQRGIPKEHLLGLRTPIGEEITREDYDKTIAEPIRKAFTENSWWKLREPNDPRGPVEWNKIRFVALIRGIPLKISGAPNFPGDKIVGEPPLNNRNEAAVDSELATLGYFTKVISGAVNNPYFRSFSRFEDLHRPEMMLVCRLDGPSASTVKRMILDGIATEKEGLAGFAYIDARGIDSGAYKEGDDWMIAAAATARKKGMPVILDNGPELFPESYPMRYAAIYYGWYAGDVVGPFVRPGFRFARGAVAVHLHSFSGATVRDPQHGWVAPFLYSGAAATLGNVYEPYLTLTPHLDVFHDRLCAGYTFAEASFMCQRVLSWMTTSVGDPLYRPYASSTAGDEKPSTGEWAAYREGAQKWFSASPEAGATALKASGKKLRSGIVFEGLGLLDLTKNDSAGAIAAFQQAGQFYKEPEDIARAAIHEAVQLRATKRGPEAVALVRKVIAAYPDSPAVPMLRLLDPPPPPPPKPPAPAPK